MSAGKEIAAAMVMMSLSFKVMLTLASVYYFPSEYWGDDIFYESETAKRYKEEGISMVPKGCPDKCGEVSIYYPFGIGPDKSCYLNEWFHINCTKSSNGAERAFLMSSFSGDREGVRREILYISIFSEIIVIKEPISTSACQTTGSGNGSNNASINNGNTKLSQTPFFYSARYNTFLIFGCGGASLSKPGEEFKQLGCTLNCSRKTTLLKTVGDCKGINCCQLPIDEDVQTYHVNFTRTESSAVKEAACNYAFFFGGSTLPYSLQRFPSRQQEEVVVPVVWRWNITKHDLLYLAPSFIDDHCGTNYDGYYMCDCRYPEGGNAYLPHGCKKIYGPKISLKKLSAIIGVSASFGFVLLIWTCVVLYKAIKKRKMKKLRQKFFKRNGGLLLQQQLLAKEGTVEKTKIFTASELDKATDHFNVDRIVGRGGQGTVYKGMLIDGQIVAVKKSQAVDEDQLEPFINEVVILSQINHRNVVKLMGCCLETEVPILVYEFIPNGTLFGLIHNNFEDELIPLSWNIRLRIASEVACALAYLHSATSVPIYHRDIKSGNILLDEKFRAKVSDFGTSRSISIDKTHLTTMVKGTFGYLDPEYFQSSQFTEKSDVYSFGVVLAELLTGQKPISFDLDDDENRSLVSRFLLCMEENRIMEILDVEVIVQGKKEDIVAMARLAQRCLNFNGKKRPTMKEVATELDAIKASHSHLPSAMETLEIESDFIA
ncbi:PREDICTED: wall-associated receptor kinase-like 1 [Ipomoea nil]|uniref:wall-associated receptor kinase-like 1 n=1 Tax=Ipomoea nil TaxID=35883 RepID=UPI0009013554|nr:PREDICTED: wall-associated receptor kinase-like 1 [Ipomoea nil]